MKTIKCPNCGSSNIQESIRGVETWDVLGINEDGEVKYASLKGYFEETGDSFFTCFDCNKDVTKHVNEVIDSCLKVEG